MDDDATHEFSSSLVENFYQQAGETFEKMEGAMYGDVSGVYDIVGERWLVVYGTELWFMWIVCGTFDVSWFCVV